MTTLDVASESLALWVTRCVEPDAFARIRRELVLNHCKWDPHVGDDETLAPFAILISPASWRQLAAEAEALAAETIRAESELMRRSDLWPELAVPRKLRRLLAGANTHGMTPSAGRVMRFDFHPTAEGWRVSEINSDVPGGYTEAWNLSRLVAETLDIEAAPAGDPGEGWARSIAGIAGDRPVALISATGYLEDREIMSYMAMRLRKIGIASHVAGINQVAWIVGKAHLRLESGLVPLGAIVRFYQAEWLARLPKSSGWQHLFVGGETPVTNPTPGILSESKGFSLVWDQLQTSLPTWRRLLPETRRLRDAPWKHDPAWLLKEKYSNNGDSVIAKHEAGARTWRRTLLHCWCSPNAWVAQRRFETQPLATPLGRLHPCLGVYVVDGRAAGIYGRLSRGPIVDYTAMDVAVLVAQEGTLDDA